MFWCAVVSVKLLCPPSSSSELQAHLFTWWGSWRGWRCRRHSHDYVPSGRSRLCPSSRPSCQGETKDEAVKRKNEAGVRHQFVSSTADRRRQTNRQPCRFISAGFMSHLMPFSWCDPPVLDDPVLLPPVAHSISHQQHSVIDVSFVAAGVVVNTWTRGGRGGKRCYECSCSSADDFEKLNVRFSWTGGPGSALTFAVELEAGQRGVDAHSYGSHLEERDAQRLLVAHRDLLVAIALGRHAWWTVTARLVLNIRHSRREMLKISTSTVRYETKSRFAMTD